MSRPMLILAIMGVGLAVWFVLAVIFGAVD